MTSEVLPTVVSVALAVAGLTLAAGGAMVATRTAATVAGGLFGAAGVVAVVSAAADEAVRSPSLGLALAGTLLGLAVVAFPTVHRDLPGMVAVVAVIALPVAQWIYAGFAGDAVELALLLAGVPLLHVWRRLETADPDERRRLQSLSLTGTAGRPMAVEICVISCRSFLLPWRSRPTALPQKR